MFFSKDMHNKKIKADESCIVNLQDYFKGNGTHFFYNDPQSDKVEYYDCFGFIPVTMVLNIWKHQKNHWFGTVISIKGSLI